MLKRFSGARFVDLRAVAIDLTAPAMRGLLYHLTDKDRASRTHHLALPRSNCMPDETTAAMLIAGYKNIVALDIDVEALPGDKDDFVVALTRLEELNVAVRGAVRPGLGPASGCPPTLPPMVARAKISAFLMTDAAFSTFFLGWPRTGSSSSSLVHLTLDGCNALSSWSLALILRYMPELLELHVPNCFRLLSDVEMMPTLAPSKIRVLNAKYCLFDSDNDVLDVVLAAMPDLRTLNLNGCCSVGSWGMRFIARHCPRLESLAVAHGKFDSESLSTVLRLCTALSELDVSHCVCMDDNTVFDISRMPNLTVLNLGFCTEITHAAIESLACRNFETTRLRGVTLPKWAMDLEAGCEEALLRQGVDVAWDNDGAIFRDV
jgi:hypothetical protein